MRSYFEIVIIRSDLRDETQRGGGERGPTEVRVDDNAGAVDDRLEPAAFEIVELVADLLHHLWQVRHVAFGATASELSPNEADNVGTGERRSAEGLQHFFNCRKGTPFGFHAGNGSVMTSSR